MTAILDNEKQQTIVCTSTYEAFMPVRLYYKLRNKKLLIDTLKELKSIEFISNNTEFIVSYWKEEQREDFFTSTIFEKVFQIDLTTIELGYGSIKNNSILHLDSRALKRALSHL